MNSEIYSFSKHVTPILITNTIISTFQFIMIGVYG